MFALRSRSVLVVLVLLLAGALMLGGCAASSPAALAAAAAAAPVAQGTAGAITLQATAVPAAQAANELARTITVVGRGEVKSKPVVARTQIGIEAMAPTVAEAMKDAQARMDAVLKALKAAGIADKDIQTSNFSINFERQAPPEPVRSSGANATQAVPAGVYRVNNMVNVTIRDVAKVGDVIDGAVNAGANNVWGINFGLDDTTSLEAQAREKAVTDARARAESLARLNGVSLGPVVSVSEVIGPQAIPYAAMEARGLGGGGGTPVEPGEVSFTTQIQVVYAIQ